VAICTQKDDGESLTSHYFIYDVSISFLIMNIDRKELEKIGFKDQTGGWGGSQGSDWIYKKYNPEIEIRTVDYDNKWHLTNDFKISFSTIEDINFYCLENLGVGVI
jgi:hypothetical protein